MKRETRYSESEFELRGVPGDGARLEGYAAKFMVPTVIGGHFREQVGNRAFNKTLKEGDVRALFNHDPNVVLGRSHPGSGNPRTLHLSTDDTGLRYEIDLPDTQQARDLWTSIDRGDISGSSFSFEAVKQEFAKATEEGGLPMRTLNEVRLFDISPVTFPAYETTEVQARSSEDVLREIVAELEEEDADDRSAATAEEPVQVVEPPEALDATQQPEPEAPRGTLVYVARLALDEALNWRP